MEILLGISICMIALCAFCGISIYLSAIGFLEKMRLSTIVWLFIFSTIVGGICSFFATESYEGITYLSNIYLILGSLSALMLFKTIFGTKYKNPFILWTFFLIILPIGLIGLLFSKQVFE